MNSAANDRHAKLLITFGLFLLLLNFPMLGIVDKAELWFGVPALYFYFFFIWALLIVLIVRIMRKKK